MRYRSSGYSKKLLVPVTKQEAKKASKAAKSVLGLLRGG